MRLRSFVRLFVALIVTGAPLAELRAQEFRGTITGRVADATDAILPGVTITGTNTATNVVVTSITNDAGLYTLPYLVPGKYAVAFELAGFKRHVREVDVRVGDRVALDVKLET